MGFANTMTDKFSDDAVVYESPDGGKTIYSRKFGSSDRTLCHIDPMYAKEMALTERWKNLKHAVFLEDPAIDDLIHQIEMLMVLKK